MPLAAMAIVELLQLDGSLGGALLLLGTAPGAPFLPLLAEIAKGDLAFSVADGLVNCLHAIGIALFTQRSVG